MKAYVHLTITRLTHQNFGGHFLASEAADLSEFFLVCACFFFAVAIINVCF